MRRSVTAETPRRSGLIGPASPANGGDPSPRVIPAVSRSLFSFLSVGLGQLIIQMSAGGSLPSKPAAGMFSKVAFSFCHVKSKPESRQRYPRLTPRAAVLPIKVRSTSSVCGSHSITKRRSRRRRSDLNHYPPRHCCCLSCFVSASQGRRRRLLMTAVIVMTTITAIVSGDSVTSARRVGVLAAQEETPSRMSLRLKRSPRPRS